MKKSPTHAPSSAPKQLRQLEEALIRLCRSGRNAHATHLILLLEYLYHTDEVNGIPLVHPPVIWQNWTIETGYSTALSSVFSLCPPREAYDSLSQLCLRLEQENDVLRDTVRTFLPYIPQDEEIHGFLCNLLVLTKEYELTQTDKGAAAAFLKECLMQPTTEGREIADAETPDCVCRLFRALLPPEAELQPEGSIYDPCCGTGRLLTAMAENTNNAVFGMDLAAAKAPFFAARNLLAGNTFPAFFTGNSITSPLGSGGELQRFDIVVSQPPFGYNAESSDALENDPYKRFERGLPRRNSGDWLHLCNCLAHAKPDSGLVMVLATKASLFRRDISVDIRRRLLEENLIDTVIALPAGLLPGTMTAPVLLIFRHNRPRCGVRFINAESLGSREGRSTRLSEADIERIRCSARTDETEEAFARTVSATEISAKEHQWDVARYVAEPAEAEQIDIAALRTEIEDLNTLLRSKRARLAELLLAMEQNQPTPPASL